MGHGVIAYKTEKEMVDEYLTTSYNLSQIENLSERYAEYFEELNDMLVQNGSIEAIEAMRDLFMGRITSHTPPVVVSVFTDNRTPFVSEDTDNNRRVVLPTKEVHFL